MTQSKWLPQRSEAQTPANGQQEAELHASPRSFGLRSHQTAEAFELGSALIHSLRSSCQKSLKERLELAGTQPRKFEMRPVWGASFMNPQTTRRHRINDIQVDPWWRGGWKPWFLGSHIASHSFH